MYVGALEFNTDILHNLRNDEITPFSLYFLSQNFTRLQGVNLKISCLFLKESSHDIVESSRYIPRDPSCALQKYLNSGAIMVPKKTDSAKKRTADARAKRFWVYRF